MDLHLSGKVAVVTGAREFSDDVAPAPPARRFTRYTLNFLAAVRTTRAALPHLLERGSGSIVTISSVNAFLPDR
jgi:short-subunit dehydrogenase